MQLQQLLVNMNGITPLTPQQFNTVTKLRNIEGDRFASNSISKGLFSSPANQDEIFYELQDDDDIKGSILDKPLQEQTETISRKRKTRKDMKIEKIIQEKAVVTKVEPTYNEQLSEVQQVERKNQSKRLITQMCKNAKLFFNQDSDPEDLTAINDSQIKPVQSKKEVPKESSKVILSTKNIFKNVFDSDEEDQTQQKQKKSPKKNEEKNIIDSFSIDFDRLETHKKCVLSPVPKNKKFMFSLYRNTSFMNTFWPEFHVHFNLCSRHFMSAKKVSSKPSSTFLISTQNDLFSEESPSYLGKVKSNLLGDVLNIFGPGLNPSKAKAAKVSPRQLLATIVFETSFFNGGRPRSFTVYAKRPQLSYYEHFNTIRMYEQEMGYNELYQAEDNPEKINVYRNRQPVWKQELGGYMLNFRGRVGKPSIKNFILERKEDEADCMLFGKVDEDRFNFDIEASISPIVAFGIVLASFDSRVMCE